MNTQVTVKQVLFSKKIMERFNSLPKVSIVENNTTILTDHLQLLSTHKKCYNLVTKKVVKKFYIKNDLLVVFI